MEALMNHALHIAVADEIQKHLADPYKLFKDTACDGSQHLSLFVGKRKARDTHMCDVDLLIVSEDRVRVIIEIEEFGFIPTKICGKFLQSGFADHFICDQRSKPVVPYNNSVLFIHVLDGSKWNRQKTGKDLQAHLIEKKIHNMLSFKGNNITAYQLFIVQGVNDLENLELVGSAVANVLDQLT
jgi:hypothetical protein